nr:DUF3107 domain-containing protein [Georgenia faecalis]
MEITIGVRNVARELTLESSASAQEVVAAVEKAITDGTSLVLTDDRGRRIVVPAQAVGYVEVGSDEPRRVGFGVA